MAETNHASTRATSGETPSEPGDSPALAPASRLERAGRKLNVFNVLAYVLLGAALVAGAFGHH